MGTGESNHGKLYKVSAVIIDVTQHKGPVGESIHEHSSLERNAVLRGSDRRTASLGRWGDSGGKVKEVGRARSHAGLENHVKTFRLHLKTSGQLSKDLKLVSGMRLSFHSVWPFSAVIRSLDRYPMVSYKERSCSGAINLSGYSTRGSTETHHLGPHWWLIAHPFGSYFPKHVSSPGKLICSPLAGI